jgi:hypothetical protein
MQVEDVAIEEAHHSLHVVVVLEDARGGICSKLRQHIANLLQHSHQLLKSLGKGARQLGMKM